MSKTLFLFVPNYVYSSDFLRTDYIKYLAANFRVIVFAPAGLFAGGNPYPQLPNLTYVKWDLQHPEFWLLFGKFLRYSLIRKYDFEPVVWRNRRKGMQDWRRKFLRIFSYSLPKALITPDLFTKLEVFFLPKSQPFAEYVKKYQPAIVLTPTPGFTHFDAEAIVLAKKYKIPTAAVNFSWDNLHNGGIHFRRPDYLIVWNEIMKNTAINEYSYPADKVFVSGVIRFDRYFKNQPGELSREDFLRGKKLNPNKKTILLTTVTKGNYPDEHLLLKDLLAARERGAFFGYPNIFVRLHPKEEVKKFAEFMELAAKNFYIERAGKDRKADLGSAIEIDEEDLLNLKHTLKYADVVVNYASTITLEAFIFDKPVVNIGYPEKYLEAYQFRHYRPIVEIGAVRLAKSFEEITDWVNVYLNNPQLDQDKRSIAREKFIKFTDGLSHQRNADFIFEIIKAL